MVSRKEKRRRQRQNQKKTKNVKKTPEGESEGVFFTQVVVEHQLTEEQIEERKKRFHSQFAALRQTTNQLSQQHLGHETPCPDSHGQEPSFTEQQKLSRGRTLPAVSVTLRFDGDATYVTGRVGEVTTGKVPVRNKQHSQDPGILRFQQDYHIPTFRTRMNLR